MSAPWSITNRPAANTAASATQAAPGSPYQNRLRALQVSLSGTGVGAAELVVRDGATGAGAILLSMDLNIAANGFAYAQLTDLDIRASQGNALTVETTGGGGANTQLDVNAQGDLVIPGMAYGATPSQGA